MSMTLEEAIKILSELHDQCCQADSIFCTDTTGARCEAVDMAISALQAQDLQPICNELAKDTNVPCKDTISRQAAINAVDAIRDIASITMSDGDKCIRKSAAKYVLSILPSAQPDGISLEWIDKHLEWLDNCDNDFAQLAKVGIRAMVDLWKKDRT